MRHINKNLDGELFKHAPTNIYINDLITPLSESEHNQPTTYLKKFWTFIKNLRKDNCSIQSLKLNDLASCY